MHTKYYVGGIDNTTSSSGKSSNNAAAQTTNTLNTETAYGGINGKIDEATFQGTIGDCWFLSGILSLSYNDEGQQIIQNAITQNDNGDYEVYFEGYDTSVQITQAELEDANSYTGYSSGDNDMLLLELSAEKLIEQENLNLTQNGLSGGNPSIVYSMLSDGNPISDKRSSDEKTMDEVLNYYAENQDKCSGTLNITFSHYYDYFNSENDSGAFSGLTNDHSYAIKSYDGETMHIVDPHDSTSDIVLTKEELSNNCGKYSITMVNFSDDEDFPEGVVGRTLATYLGCSAVSEEEAGDFKKMSASDIPEKIDNLEYLTESAKKYGFKVCNNDDSTFYVKVLDDGTVARVDYVADSDGQVGLKTTYKNTDGSYDTYYYKFSENND